MIRFKCVYCGQRIVAREDDSGKKSRCPTCEHMLVVPYATEGRPAISVESTEPITRKTRPHASRWGDSIYQNPKQFPMIYDEDIEVYKESFGFLIPTYDEMSMFLMAVIWILMTLIYAANNQLLRRISLFVREDGNLSAFIFLSFLALVFFAGLVLCIYHVFTTKDKSDFEKNLMLMFAVVTNILVGVIAGIYVIKHAAIGNWQIVFSIWNIINGVLLYLMFQFRIIDEDCISEREATGLQIVLGLAVVLIIFIFCNYVFKLRWAVIFSICIIYTTSFNRALQNVLPGLVHREDEQAS